MMDPEEKRPRAARRAAALAGASAQVAFGPRVLFTAALRWLRAALAEEADLGRLAPWLAVGFGAGVLAYFVAPNEPSWAGALAVFVAVALTAFGLRWHPRAFAIFLSVAAIAAGFATASVRATMISHPVLTQASASATLKGFVESRDAGARSDRVVLRVTGTDAKTRVKIPPRVRIAFRRGAAPSVGEHIEVRARLRPLVGPIRPGGYDFALGAYFSGIGATGFALGKSKTVDAPSAIPLSIRAAAWIEKVRRGLAARIRLALPGDAGAVAVALVTGIRDGISHDVNEALRISGLYHVISISGLHMALIAAAIFAIARGSLTLIPGLALRRPIKKWAALLALLGVTLYLLLSGAEVATQRSYIMIAVVLVGVLLDRPALTLRTLAAAAVITLIVSPEAVLNPGFQMSFAATLALVSLYERFVPQFSAPPEAGASATGTVLRRGGRWVVLGAITSLVAGLATAVYAAFYFHRFAPYGLLANVASMPLVSLAMFGALIGVALLPFGFDPLGWWMMGFGIDGMIWVAKQVASIGGAEGRVQAFGAGAVLLATVALLIFAIPATRLRLFATPFAVAAILLIGSASRQDVFIDAEGDVIAVRAPNGELSVHSLRRDRFAIESWLAADGKSPRAAQTESAFVCDARGCTIKLGDGALVAVALKPEALLEDCSRAALVIYRRDVPAGCKAAVVDRQTLATTGALALRRMEDGWAVLSARSPYADRPWFGRAKAPDPKVLARINPKTPSSHPSEVFSDEEPAEVPPNGEDEADEDRAAQ